MDLVRQICRQSENEDAMCRAFIERWPEVEACFAARGWQPTTVMMMYVQCLGRCATADGDAHSRT